MKIILCGYRGCGKTTVGRTVAQALSVPFHDVDDVTCERFGIDSIAEIWKQHGEPAWRRAEVEVTRELCAARDMVIGLGGGTLMQPGARQAVEQARGALRVYLRAEPEELLRRIQADTRSAATRPNLTALGGGLEEIKAVLAERGPVYEAVADLVIDVTHMPPADAAERILESVRGKAPGSKDGKVSST